MISLFKSKQKETDSFSFSIFLSFILFFALSASSYAQNCTVNAGNDSEICETETLTLTGVLGGNIQSSLWVQTAGPSVIIATPTNAVTEVTGVLGGNTYTFKLTAVCLDLIDANTQSIDITVNPISIADAGNDLQACPGTYSLNATPSDPNIVAVTGEWTIIGDNDAGLTIDNISLATSGITLSETSVGDTSLEWRLKNSSSQCETADIITITNEGGVVNSSAGNNRTLSQCFTTATSVKLDGTIGGDGTGGQIGTWSFVSGPSVPTIVAVNEPKTRVNGLIEGTYVFRWTVQGPCAVGRNEVSITVPPATQDITNAVVPDDNQRFCDPGLTTSVLTGNVPSFAGETVQWTQTGGPTLPAGSIVSPNSPTTEVNNLNGSANRTYTFEYKIIGGPINPNCNSTDQAKIHFNPSFLSIEVNGGSDILLPQDITAVTIPFTSSGGSRTRYEIISTPDSSGLLPLTNIVGNSLDLDLTAGEGIYKIRFVRDSAGDVLTACSIASDEIDVIVSLTPTEGNAGSNFVLECYQDSTTLAGNSVSVGVATWSQVSGPNTAVFDDVNSPTPTVTGLIPGEYVFRYLVSAGPNSIDSFSDTFVTYALPPVAVAGTPATICPDTHVLDANDLKPGETGQWTVSPSAGVVFTDATFPKTLVSGLAPSTNYVFEWTVSASDCDSASALVLIATLGNQSPSIADAGPDICTLGNSTSAEIVAIETETPFVGVGTWTFVPNSLGVTPIITPDGSNSLKASISGMTQPGNYEFKWTVNGGGGINVCTNKETEDSMIITVAPDPTNVDAGPDQTICGNQIQMAASTPAAGLTGKWEQVSGNAGWTVDYIDREIAIFTNFVEGNYAFKWVVSKGDCSSAESEMNFSISSPPTQAIAGAIPDVCDNSTVTLTGNSITNGIGTWSVESGPNNPTISDVNDPIADVSNLITGDYVFKWTSSKGINCPDSEATTTVSVQTQIDLSGKDQELCAASQVLLEANPGATGTWAKDPNNASASPISITNNSANTAIVELDPTITATYRFRFKSSGTCSSSDELEIINTRLPDAPNAGPDQEICTDTSNSVTMAAAGEPGTWILVSGPNIPNISSDIDKEATISGLIEGLYIYEWNVGSTPCTELKDVVRINVYDTPSTADAGPDQSGGTAPCQVLPQLDAVAPTTGIGTWTLSTNPPIGSIKINSPNDPKSTLTVTPNTLTGNYIFTWTVSNGNPICSDSVDTVVLEFSEPPASDANAGPDQELCGVVTSTLFGNTVSVGAGTWTQESGPNTSVIDNQFNAQTAVSNLITGTYIFKWTIISGGCSTEDTVEIEVYDDSSIVLSAGVDQTVGRFDNIFLNGTDVSPEVGRWEFSSGTSTPVIVDINDNGTQVTGVVPGVYEFAWILKVGACPQKEDTVQITVVGSVDIEIEKMVDIPKPVVGSTVSYSVVVTNLGVNTATGVSVSDQLPSGLTLVGGSVSNGGVFNSGNNEISWTGLALDPGKSITLEYQAIVNNPTGVAGEYTNTASLSGVNEIDENSQNDQASVTITPSVVADIVLSKQVSNSNPNEGDIIIYTIAVKNNSISEVTNVVITDDLPTGLTFLGGVGTVGTWDNATGIWTIGNMQPVITEKLVLQVEVGANSSGLPLTNTITNSQDQLDQNITLDDDSETILVSSADLVTVKEVNKTLVKPGEVIWYTIKVKNNGPNTATNVSLTDVLPVGVTHKGYSPNTANYTPGTGLWTIGAIPDGDTVELKIFAEVNPGTSGNKIINTTSRAVGDQSDASQVGDDLQALIIVDVKTDIAVTKTVDNSSPNEGGTVIYTITVQNNGSINATNLLITDVLPDGLTYVSSAPNAGSWTPPSVWDIGTLASGASVSSTLNATVDTGRAGQSLTNTVTNTQDQFDSNITPDDMDETVVVTAADLVTEKMVSKSSVTVEEIIWYTLKVTNNGPNDATSVELTDILPSELSYQGFSPNTANYNSVTGLWTIGTILNGDTVELKIFAKVLSSAAGKTTTNTTSKAAGSEADPSDVGNVLSADIFVDNETDIVLSKRVNKPTPNEGDVVIFDIEVTNNGPIDATNLVITDILGPGLSLVPGVASGVASEGIWDGSARTWTFNTLPAGVTETLLLQVVVAGGTAGQTLTNMISNTQDQLDSNLTLDDLIETVVVNSSDLITVKTASNIALEEGDIFTYTILVENKGPNDATNVTVKDQLPNNITHSSNDSNGSYDVITGIWSIGDIANGASVSLNINVQVNNGTAAETTISNIIDAAFGDQTDVNTAGDILQADVYIKNETDIVLTKTVSNATPNAGDQIFYTIVVENKGPIAATNLVVTDVLPAGLVLLSSDPSSGVYVNSDWEISALAVGQSETLQLNVLVGSSTGGQILTNTISNTQDQLDTNATVDDLDATISITSVDLVTKKVVDNDTPAVGGTITYTITIENKGPDTATNIALVDHLPVGVTYVSDDSTVASPYDSVSGVWSVPSIVNGAVASLNISATIDTATGGTTIINTTTAAISDQSESSTIGDELEATVYIANETDITLIKTVDNSAPSEGDLITYTIGVTNNGPISATGLKVTDLLPQGLSLISAIPDSNKGVWSAPVWNIGTLANGASASLILTARVDSGTAGSTIINTISNAQDQLDSNSTPDDLDEVITITSSDLITVKSVDNATPDVGNTITYTINVTNNGPNDATGVLLLDLLPIDVTYSSDNTSGNYNSTLGIWFVGDISNGSSETLTISATVNASAAGKTIINTTTSALGDQVDISTVGDVLEASIFVNNEADVVLSKSVDNNKPNEGDLIRYLISVTNNSALITATNISITDVLPSGITYIAGIPSTGIWNSPTWSINTLAAGNTETLIVEARVDTGTAGQNLTNTISNTQDQLDTNLTSDDLEETIVVSSSDLVTVKTVDNAAPDVGGTIVYTLTVTNNGLSDATGVSLIDNLPFGVTYDSHTGDGSFSDATSIWDIGNVDLGATKTLNISAIVDSNSGGSTIVNSTTAAIGDQADPTLNGDVLEATIYVANKTDVALSKVVNDLTPDEGDTIVYAIKVSNNGNTTATNLVIEDILPSGLTYISGIPSAGIWANPYWSLNSLNAGETKTLLLSVRVDIGTAGQSILNTISNTQDQLDTNATLDDDNETIVVTSVDLVTVKTVDNLTPAAGGSVTYTIEVTNNGPSNATNVSLVDNLPNAVVYQNSNGNGTYNNSTGIWTIGDLIVGNKAILTIDAQVNANAAGTTIVNTTTAAIADQADVSAVGDVLEASIFVANKTDIQLSKIVDPNGTNTPNEGDNVVYIIEVQNNGPIAATNLLIKDVLPAGLTYVSAIPTLGNWNAQTWTINKLDNLSNARLVLTVNVDSGTAGQLLTNTISNTQDQLDSNLSIDDLEETILVSSVDLQTVITVDNATPSEGDEVVYTIEVTNQGPNDATGVKITDALPTGVTFLSATINSTNFNSGSGIWTIGNIANGDSERIEITAEVDSGTSASTIINAINTAEGDQADPSSAGDVLEAPIYIENKTDILLSKTVNNSAPNEGETIIYTISVENKGDIEVTNMNITDVLPSGLTYVLGSPTAGSWNSPIWSLNSLNPGEIAYLSLQASVDAGTAGQSLTNTISNTQDQLDTNASSDDLDETVVVAFTDLITVKTANNTTPDEGEIIEYEITVTNNGTSDATNVSLVDHLPQGVTYQTDDSAGAYNFGSGIWNIGDLANGSSISLKIEALVSLGTAGSTIINTTTAAEGDQTDPSTIGDQLSVSIHIDNETDIVLSKVVDNSTPNEGETIFYTIIVTNKGSIKATNIVITDALPTGLIYVSGIVTAGTWTNPNWTINELDPSSTATLLLEVNVAASTGGQILINTVSHTQDQLDTDDSLDDLTESITVASSNLVTVKIVDDQTPSQDENIIYTISVTNYGPSDATGVSLTDVLPTGVTFDVSANTGIPEFNRITGIWTIGTVLYDASNPANTAREIEIVCSVDSNLLSGSTVVNKTSAAKGDQSDPTTAGDMLEASIFVNNETDIILTKTVNNNAPNEGETIEYVITVVNEGATNATNLVVEDLLPSGLSFVYGLPSEGLWVAPNWYVGELSKDNGSNTATLSLFVSVDPGAAGNSYTNTISNTQDQFDTNATLDDNEETIVVSACDLRVEKIVDNTNPVELSTIIYTISVTNDGPIDATGVSITDNLPAGVSYLGDDSSGLYNSGSGLWNIGDLLNGQTKTLQISARVDFGTVGDVIVNTTLGLSADQKDPNTSNNNGSATINVVRDVDLSLTKNFVDGTDIPAVGNEKTFEIRLTNEGKSIATGVVVTDMLPDGYTFLRYNSTTGVYDFNTGLWQIGSVAPGITVVLNLDVLVLGTGDHDNCAEVTAMNENDLDSTPGNGDVNEDDYACIGLSYISTLNLSIDKSVVNNQLTPNVGDEITFNIEVTNEGQLDANSVDISDVLPSGFTYIGYKSTAGLYNSSLSVWSIGTIQKGSSETLTIAAQVNASGDYENCALIVNSSNIDTDSSDDQSCVTVTPVALVDLTLEKIVSDNKPSAGDEIEFTIRLLNTGPSEATGVTVKDILPSGYTFVSSSSNIGQYDNTSGIWDIGTLAVGVEEDLNLIVKVNSTGKWDNTAQVETCNELDKDSTPGNSNSDEDDQDTVEVTVGINLFIPEEFTPNGDGMNDVFEIVNLGVLYPNFRIVIVNRWGSKVYEYKHTGDPDEEPVWWNGYPEDSVNLGSADLRDGTYFYTIEFDNNDRAPQTGWVYLRR